MKKFRYIRWDKVTIFVVVTILILNSGLQTVRNYQLMRTIDGIKQDNMAMTTSIKSMQNRLDDFMDKWDIGVFDATAYSPYDDRNGLNSDGNPNSTATGTSPAPGTIAVNFNSFPQNTRMWIQGYGWGKALDTGGNMIKYPRQIDVFMWTYPEAMKWGRRQVIVVWQKT